MTAFSPLLCLRKVFCSHFTAGHKNRGKLLESTPGLSVNIVSQTQNWNIQLYIFCWILSLQSTSKVKFTWMIPDLVTSVLAGGTCPVSRGGDSGMEELFLTVTMTRSWPAPPVWPPPPASLSSGLESPENWKEKIFALKSFYRNYANSKREGTIKFKILNPISLKLNVILNHLQQTRFTNPDKTL